MERLPTRRESIEAMKQWRIAEQFSEAKDKEKGTEDGFAITDNCVVVLDGVSGVDPKLRVEGVTPGQLAVRAALNVILNDPHLTSENIVQLLTQALQDARHKSVGDDMPSFVFAAFFPKENVIVRVGDCSYLVDGAGDNREIAPDHARAVVRRRILEKRLSAGEQEGDLLREDPTRERMRSTRAWAQHFANNEEDASLGYGVMNGSVVPESFVERIDVPPSARSVILATDGYPPSTLRGTLAETEAALRELQQKDPLGISRDEPSVRTVKPAAGQTATDDRTYVRLER